MILKCNLKFLYFKCHCGNYVYVAINHFNVYNANITMGIVFCIYIEVQK